MSEQLAVGPFTKRIDNFYQEFQAIANEYQNLQPYLQHRSMDRLYELLPPSAPLTSPANISRAVATVTAAAHPLQIAKPILKTFSRHAAAAFQDRFEVLAKAGDLDERSSVMQLLSSRNRDRFVKLFGSVGVAMMCAEDVDGRVRDVEWFLERAASEDIGSEEWARSFARRSRGEAEMMGIEPLARPHGAG